MNCTFPVEVKGDYTTVTKMEPFGGRVLYVSPGATGGDGTVTIRTRSDKEENTFPFLSERICEWVRPGKQGDGFSDEGSGADESEDEAAEDAEAEEQPVDAEEAARYEAAMAALDGDADEG